MHASRISGFTDVQYSHVYLCCEPTRLEMWYVDRKEHVKCTLVRQLWHLRDWAPESLSQMLQWSALAGICWLARGAAYGSVASSVVGSAGLRCILSRVLSISSFAA